MWSGKSHNGYLLLDRGQESGSFHEARCVSIPNLVQKTWKIPGELLVFSLHQKLEEAGSNQHQDG